MIRQWTFGDLTLACEYSNSKLVDDIAVADVDAEKHVDDSLNDILKLKFCQNIKADVWSSF